MPIAVSNVIRNHEIDDDDDNDEREREECLRANRCLLDTPTLAALKKLTDDRLAYTTLKSQQKRAIKETLQAAAARCCEVVEFERVRAVARRDTRHELRAPDVPFSSVANCLIGAFSHFFCFANALFRVLFVEAVVTIAVCVCRCGSLSLASFFCFPKRVK
jgi:hypothetical protein